MDESCTSSRRQHPPGRRLLPGAGAAELPAKGGDDSSLSMILTANNFRRIFFK